MTKSELKPGYLVEFNDGNLYMVMNVGANNEIILASIPEWTFNKWFSLSVYTKNLVNKFNDELTIVKVYSHNKFANKVFDFSTKDRKLLWTRPQRKKYTYEQLSEIIGMDFEIVR